ncbi:hypothetical protein B0H19DRAFT_1140309 [Mycena capillaripes]|nr:hypothetical protein B0H19DRAFT_1140309 [Mycena capillaripes]
MEQGLPIDLEREIFEMAAIMYPGLLPTLLRVCHRVRTWIEPLLYRVLIIADYDEDLISAAKAKLATFLQSAVRHVFLDKSLKIWETQKSLLSKCTGAIDLYMDGTFEPDLLPLLDETHLRRLSFSVLQAPPAWDHSILHHPLFLSVTHLELFQESWDMPQRPSWSDWSPLASLPSLTHLCLSEDFASDTMPQALAECSRLVVAVVALWDAYKEHNGVVLAEGLSWGDPRLVVISMSIARYRNDWEIGAQGGDDFWVRAERFISRKRRGEIENNCYFLTK